MAATVLVRTALWQAAVLLQDAAPQFNRWTEAALIGFLNEAQLALATYLPSATSRVDAIKLRTGTLQTIEAIAPADCKPGDGSTPADPILGTSVLFPVCSMGADGLSPGRAIRVVDRKSLDATDPLWHMSTGAAVTGLVYDPATPRYFHVVPGVKGSQWMRLAFNAQPQRVPDGGAPGSPIYHIGGVNTAKLSVSDEHTEAIVNYIVARANMIDCEWSDGNKAAAFANLFITHLNAKVTAATGTNPNLKRLPMSPESIGRAA